MTAHPRDLPSTLSPETRSQRGASFAELMLAVLVISTTLVASHQSMTGTVSAYHYFADGAHESLLLAKEIHEAALLLPWENGEDSEFEFGTAETLDDLDGMAYSPPRSAGYDVVTSHIGWSQEVEIKTVDMADPSQEVEPGFTGPTHTELTVTIKDGNKVVGSYSWWLTEPTGS